MKRKTEIASPSSEPKLPTSAVWKVTPHETPPQDLQKRLRNAHVRIEPAASTLTLLHEESGELVWESAATIPLGRAAISISEGLMLHRAEIMVRSVDGGRVKTSSLEGLHHVRTRSLLRVAAPAGLRIAIAGQEFPARDLSDTGLSFTVPSGATPFSIGQVLPITCNWHDRLRVLATLSVRHVSPGFVGGALQFDETEDRERHHEEIDAISYPFTRIGTSYSRDLWELFIDSGYFSLSNKQPQDFLTQRAAFNRVSRILATPNRLGVQIVYPTSRGIDCSYSVIAEYPRTAMSIHTGRRSKGKDPRGISGREVLRDAYLRVLDWIRRCEVDWMSVWVQNAAPAFIKGMLLHFVESHVDGHLADVHIFRALEIPCDRAIPSSPPIHARRAEHRETAEVFELFGQKYPSTLAAARCWHPGADTSSNWAEVGLMHDRAIFVVRRNDELVGASICEATPEGVHVYGLFDVVHLAIDDADPETEQALLDAAVVWYRGLGKRHFIYAAAPTHAVDGAYDLGLTHGTVLSTRLFPELYQHVWNFMAPNS